MTYSHWADRPAETPERTALVLAAVALGRTIAAYGPLTGPGWCGCECGRRTELAKRTELGRGIVAGEPRRFITNHRPWKHRSCKDVPA